MPSGPIKRGSVGPVCFSGRRLAGKASARVLMNPTKLQQAIVYIVQQLGSVNRTNLVKLVYLADESHYNEFGKQLTDAEYRRQDMGPLPVHFNTIVEEMRGKEIQISEQPVGQGMALVHKPGPKPRFAPMFSTDEARILANTVRLFGKLTKKSIIEVVYKTRPMLALLEQEKDNNKLLGHAIRFEDFVPQSVLNGYQSLLKDIDFSVKGTPVQIQERDMAVYHNTLSIRQRATRHAFKGKS